MSQLNIGYHFREAKEKMIKKELVYIKERNSPISTLVCCLSAIENCFNSPKIREVSNHTKALTYIVYLIAWFTQIMVSYATYREKNDVYISPHIQKSIHPIGL